MTGCVAVSEPPDDRSPLALAMEWTSRVTTISLEMVLPGAAGYWADQKLDTEPVLLLVGVILGFGTALWHLIKLAGSAAESPGSRRQGGNREKK